MTLSRTDERFSLSLDVYFLNIVTETVDLSMGGMQIITNDDIHSENLSIGLQLTDQLFVQLFGQLAWTKPLSNNKHLYGIEFVELSNDTRYTLENYLNC